MDLKYTGYWKWKAYTCAYAKGCKVLCLGSSAKEVAL